MLGLSQIVKLDLILWNMQFSFVILADNTILISFVFFLGFVDYLNTLEFIKTVGDVGEAKTVFRNHIERKDAVTTSEVEMREVIYL